MIRIHGWYLAVIAGVIGSGGLGGVLYGQAYRRVAPQKPAAHAPGQIVVPTTKIPATAPANRVILPKLRGLVFIPNPKALVRTGYRGKLPANGIVIENLPVLNRPKFIAQVAPRIGKPFTLADIQTLSSQVVQWYTRRGRPLMDVAVPPQNISSGIVQVVVSVYKVGRVNVTGNKWFSSKLLRFESGIQVGKPVTLHQLQADLNWLNSNPFRQVNAVFSPGAQAGETDVNLQTHDQFPLRVYSGYDNEGVPLLGRSEYNVGFNWGNAFGLDQQLSYQYTRSFAGKYSAHSLDWMIPLPWRDRLIIFGSYEQEKPGFGSGFAANGESGQASVRYMHTLPGWSWLHQQIGLGYDFKTTNNNLEFGGTQVSTSQNSLNQLLLIYNAHETDAWGATALQNQFVINTGELSGQGNRSTTTVNQAGLAYPRSYLYDQVALNRIFLLPGGFTSSTRFVAQVANVNLPDSETLDAGGEGSVRGYNPETALGSEGELFSEELRTPACDPTGFLNLPGYLRSSLDFGVFFDYADVYQVQNIAGSSGRADLASVGAAVYYNLGRNLSVDMDYGQQLRKAPGSTRRGGEFDVAITLSF